MTDHHEAVKTQGRLLKASITSFEIFAVDLPFQKPFRHAACLRNTSESIFLKCVTDQGTIGFGEALPREYVTGETRDSACELLRDRILPHLIGKAFDSMTNVKKYLEDCDGKAPADWISPNTPQAAAWCAVDLALMDTFSREFKESLAASGTWNSPNYSAVISAEPGLPFLLSALAARLFGLDHIKLKVDGESGIKSLKSLRKLIGWKCHIRVDANMAWNREQAISMMTKMSGLGVRYFEQPVPAGDLDSMAEIVRATKLKVIADESLRDRQSLVQLIKKKACTGINIRLSKCGGFTASLARAREARQAALEIQVGCQVGESSLLSAAQLVLIRQIPELIFLEGCFGHHLLKEDPAKPVLQFGYRGRPPKHPEEFGWGVAIDERILNRWTVSHDVVSRPIRGIGT